MLIDKKEKVGIDKMLKKARQKKRLTYDEVAFIVDERDVTPQTVKRWENGLEFPSMNCIYALSGLYEIPRARLIQARCYSFERAIERAKNNGMCIAAQIAKFSFGVATVGTVGFYVFSLIASIGFFTQSFSGFIH